MCVCVCVCALNHHVAPLISVPAAVCQVPVKLNAAAILREENRYRQQLGASPKRLFVLLCPLVEGLFIS